MKQVRDSFVFFLNFLFSLAILQILFRQCFNVLLGKNVFSAYTAYILYKMLWVSKIYLNFYLFKMNESSSFRSVRYIALFVYILHKVVVRTAL